MSMGILRPVVLLSLSGLLAAACSADNSAPNATAEGPGPSAVVSAKDFSLSRFEDSTQIDNTWFPLKPGTQWVYQGKATDDGERLARRVVFTVTDLTKEVAGVRTVVVWDRDYNDGELVETELAFFAQDTDGNVWHLGQYPEEYEDGKFDKAPAWIEGEKGARAGLAMKAQPRLKTPDYAQGFAPPPLYWDDRARVYKIGVRTCVPVDCYENVLVMEEFERRIPGAFQLKYYAPGVGGVRVGWRGPKEEEKEELVLVDLRHLDQESLEKVRKQALALEERAYRISKVYRATQPAVPIGG
jgi:ketosteroid isomerase-like protein